MRALAIPAALLLGSLAVPSPARAAEGEQGLSLGAAFTHVTVQQKGDGQAIDGGTLSLQYRYGVNDAFSLQGTLTGGTGAGPDGLSEVGSAMIGLTYSYDVIKYVPTVTGGVGVMAVTGGGLDTQFTPVVDVGIGLEVLASRRWSWGAFARFDIFPSTVTLFTIGPRLTYHWGFF